MDRSIKKERDRPVRKTTRLRQGRVSILQARYFITSTTQRRVSGLSRPLLIEQLHAQLRSMQASEDFNLHCATVMPDHIHLLFTLRPEPRMAWMDFK
ncbi:MULTISPECIES: transposase [unclassified Lentimonas]|uniref:transposase n=1 Tax=unclassified Lentimonas TaxID=2630993 RepID=UPI001389A46F